MRRADIGDIADRLIASRPTIRLARGPGAVIWLTGLSGAGKTTVGGILERRFQAAGLPLVGLDGDVLRALFAADAGHQPARRLALALAYGRLCREIAGRGLHVLCATISMFHEARDWNRANIAPYFEIYLRVPLDELRRRDPKGLYAGGAGDLVGVDLPAEEPRDADLIVDHAEGRSPAETAAIVEAFLRRVAGLDLGPSR
ncbi:MAG: adenylyl-sulfate kinase [Alphaproteobacteria bacterium]|nr:adenylyl-sulfate kinase [Alphaproteobacteria bacterium]